MSGSSHSGEKGSHTKTIDYVIYVESISWTLPVPIARKRAVEAVAEPIDSKTHNRADKSQRIELRQVVADPGQDHAEKAEQRQVIGIDPSGHAASDADRTPPSRGSSV